jgi:hypothetical protein
MLGTKSISSSLFASRILDWVIQTGTIILLHGQGGMRSVSFLLRSSTYSSKTPCITPLLLSCIYSVATAYRKSCKDLAGSLDPKLHSAGYGLVPVDVHVPILDIPQLPDKSGRSILSNAVIQGTFDGGRRAYSDIFKDLIKHLHGLLHPSCYVRF